MHRERVRQKIAEQKAKKLAAKRGPQASAAPAKSAAEAPAVMFDPQAHKVEAAMAPEQVWVC